MYGERKKENGKLQNEKCFLENNAGANNTNFSSTKWHNFSEKSSIYIVQTIF